MWGAWGTFLVVRSVTLDAACTAQVTDPCKTGQRALARGSIAVVFANAPRCREGTK